MEEEDEKDEEKEKKRVKVTSPVARPPASPTWEQPLSYEFISGLLTLVMLEIPDPITSR